MINLETLPLHVIWNLHQQTSPDLNILYKQLFLIYYTQTHNHVFSQQQVTFCSQPRWRRRRETQAD